MSWQNKTITPKRSEPPKFRTRYPCPGIFRFIGMISFLIVSLGLYYGGSRLFGLKAIDWSAPVWTTGHIILTVACVLMGLLAGLIGASFGMTIEVRSERLNEFFITLCQFLINGSLTWVFTIGAAMSLALGQKEAKAAVIRQGAESSVIHVILTGTVLGLIWGILFFLIRSARLPFLLYFALALGLCLGAAWWYFDIYNIHSNWWVGAGIVIPIILQILTPAMIERDQNQRRLAMEQSSDEGNQHV